MRAAVFRIKSAMFGRRFGYAFNTITFEVPAKMFEPGEEPLTAAIRELEEETGLTASEIIHIGDMYTTPALIDEVIHMYIATGLGGR